jgi:SHS2 domain-containing protein
MAAGFELTDHTADIGIRAWGESAGQVFEQAALAMVSLLYDVGSVHGSDTITIELDAPDGELLLAAWLNELLFVIESRRLAFAAFAVDVAGPAGRMAGARPAIAPPGAGRPDAADATSVCVPWRLRAAGVGEALDARRHAFRPAVKAATLHQLRLHPAPGGWEGCVLLDV